MQAILNLELGFRIDDIAVLIGIGDSGTIGSVRETEALRGRSKQTSLQTRNSLVDQIVDRVDNVIYERLEWVVSTLDVGVGRSPPPQQSACRTARGINSWHDSPRACS